ACNRVVGDVYRDVQDLVHRAAEALRPAQGDVESFLSLDHLREGLAADRRFDDHVHIRGTHSPELTLARVHAKFQVRLPHDAEDPDVLAAADRHQPGLDLLSQLFQLDQVGTEYLDGIVPLDAGQGLHDVGPDVLGGVPVHSDKPAVQLSLDLFGQLHLRARPVVSKETEKTTARFDGLPFAFGEEGDVDFDAVKAGRVSAVVGPADLRNDGLHLGVLADQGAGRADFLGDFVQRRVYWEGANDPKVSFLQFGHE